MSKQQQNLHPWHDSTSIVYQTVHTFQFALCPCYISRTYHAVIAEHFRDDSWLAHCACTFSLCRSLLTLLFDFEKHDGTCRNRHRYFKLPWMNEPATDAGCMAGIGKEAFASVIARSVNECFHSCDDNRVADQNDEVLKHIQTTGQYRRRYEKMLC